MIEHVEDRHIDIDAVRLAVERNREFGERIDVDRCDRSGTCLRGCDGDQSGAGRKI